MNITSDGSAGNNLSVTIQLFKETHPIASWAKFGLFDEDYIKSINVHWLKFLPPHQTNHYVLAALYVIIMLTGWCGNAFVIYMFLRTRSLRTPANTLVLNLAISDILMMSKMPIFIFNSIALGPALGKTGCRIYGFVGGLSGTVSICTLAAISLNRYYVIKFPLNMRFTSLRAKICIAFTWIYSVVFAGIPLLNSKLGSYVPEGYLTSCSYNYLSPDIEVKIFILVFFVAAWVVPFMLITFCYVNIWKTVLETRNITKTGQESSRNIKEEEKRKQDIKLAGTILLIIILWFTAWTPYSVVSLLGISNRADLIPPLASMIPALFCKTASCIDPFVYAITNPKFKYEVRKRFCKGGLEQRGSTKIWATQTIVERSHAVIRPKMHHMHSCQESEDVEEEFITVSNKKAEVDQERKLQNNQGSLTAEQKV